MKRHPRQYDLHAIALLGATTPARDLGLLEIHTYPIHYKRNPTMSEPRDVYRRSGRPELPSELSRYPESQRGCPIPIEDITDENDYVKEVEDEALRSGMTLTAANDYARRRAASTKRAYEEWKNRKAQGSI
jgi:hypothetical protein